MKRMRRRRELRKWEWKIEMKMKTTNSRVAQSTEIFFLQSGWRGSVCDSKRGAQEKRVLHAVGDQVSNPPFFKFLFQMCLPGSVPSWSLSLCPASTKRSAKASSRMIISCLLSERWALSSTALEGFSMAFSWTGSKHSRKHSQKHSQRQVKKHFHFPLVITNLRTSYRTAMGVEMVLLTALVATLSTTSLLGKVRRSQMLIRDIYTTWNK